MSGIVRWQAAGRSTGAQDACDLGSVKGWICSALVAPVLTRGPATREKGRPSSVTGTAPTAIAGPGRAGPAIVASVLAIRMSASRFAKVDGVVRKCHRDDKDSYRH